MEGKEEGRHKPYRCEHCDLDFHLDTSKFAHMTIEHMEPPPHQCTVCNTAYFSTSVFEHHLYQHCLDTSTPESVRCCLCSLQYSSEHGLRVHLCQHTGGKLSFQPKKCKYLTRGKLLTCDYCHAIFLGTSRLREHMKTHRTRKRNYVCDNCQQTFEIKLHLMQHIRGQECKSLPQNLVEKCLSQVSPGLMVSKLESIGE